MARTKSKPVGALWKHAPTGGQTNAFLTGVIDLGALGEVPVAVFKNDRKKEGSKQPDYRIVLSRRNGRSAEASQSDEL